MVMKLNLLGLPHNEFKSLIQNYYSWIENIEETVFLYIELNRLNLEKAKELVSILQTYSQIDIKRIQELLDQCLCNKEIKEQLKAIYIETPQEKEWIVYYNHRDVGHRVKAKQYTEALLAAYEKYGSDGKITKVEEA